MNVAFSIVLLFILLDCVMNEKPPCAKGCHVPLTAFYWPVKALLILTSIDMTLLKGRMENQEFRIRNRNRNPEPE